MFVKYLSNQINNKPVRAKSWTQCKPIQKSQSRANGAKSKQEKKGIERAYIRSVETCNKIIIVAPKHEVLDFQSANQILQIFKRIKEKSSGEKEKNKNANTPTPVG